MIIDLLTRIGEFIAILYASLLWLVCSLLIILLLLPVFFVFFIERNVQALKNLLKDFKRIIFKFIGV